MVGALLSDTTFGFPLPLVVAEEVEIGALLSEMTSRLAVVVVLPPDVAEPPVVEPAVVEPVADVAAAEAEVCVVVAVTSLRAGREET